MAFDDLVQGLKMFQGGLQSLAQSTAINTATQNLQAIQSSQMDETTKRMQQTQLAQQTAMNLSSLNASPEQIQATHAAIAPPKIENSGDAYQQALATGDPKMMKQAKDMQGFENANPMALGAQHNAGEANVANIKAKAEVEAANVRNSNQDRKNKYKITTDFNNATKDIVGNLDAFDKLDTLVSSKNPIGDAAVKVNLARVVGNEKGKIPVQEMAQYTGSQALKDKLERAVNKGWSGVQFTEKDRGDIANLIKNVRDAKNAELTDQVNKHAGQAYMTGMTDSAEEAKQMIIGGANGSGRLNSLMGAQGAVAKNQANAPAPDLIPTTIKLKDGRSVPGFKDKNGNYYSK